MMLANELIHVNECGLPLNSIEWLETHHRSKAAERERMIRDLRLKRGSLVIDAGCGPGLWTPLLARAIGRHGRIIGVDISSEALITAQRRHAGTPYQQQLQYKCAALEQLPVPYQSVDSIFSANVSQYLPDPVGTFAAMGRYLTSGGRLIIKDIDFGTMRFSNIEPDLQARVFQAREQWERQRVAAGYSFEDSWVGSKLASYLRQAGYQDVQERSYRIVRRYPLSQDFRCYLQGIAEWFVCEGAPFLDGEDVTAWLRCFLDEQRNVLDQETFVSEETEFVVSGVWRPCAPTTIYHMDELQKGAALSR
ncbi:MAG TPA: methyltransferase domain-containing protein [Ktedonobacteraceae bacterium]|nr:methyltransferase domain-containing protein [Ktedonobacteraceae bacterium]